MSHNADLPFLHTKPAFPSLFIYIKCVTSALIDADAMHLVRLVTRIVAQQTATYLKGKIDMSLLSECRHLYCEFLAFAGKTIFRYQKTIPANI